MNSVRYSWFVVDHEQGVVFRVPPETADKHDLNGLLRQLRVRCLYWKDHVVAHLPRREN